MINKTISFQQMQWA